jgi:hypothetical protein
MYLKIVPLFRTKTQIRTIKNTHIYMACVHVCNNSGVLSNHNSLIMCAGLHVYSTHVAAVSLQSQYESHVFVACSCTCFVATEIQTFDSAVENSKIHYTGLIHGLTWAQSAWASAGIIVHVMCVFLPVLDCQCMHVCMRVWMHVNIDVHVRMYS